MSVLISESIEFLAYWTFAILAYWPNFFQKNVEYKIESYLKLYVLMAILCSVGVILQWLLYNYFSIEFGKIDTYLNRTGFGFTWLDYSFLSVFLVSAIPIVNFKMKVLNLCFCVVLLIGAIVTSARTGVFSVIFVYIAVSSIATFKSVFFKGEITKRNLLQLVAFSVFMFLIPVLWSLFSDRELSSSSSGRFEGYFLVFQALSDMPFLGYMYDTELYKFENGAVPHNIFLYVLSMSGLVGLVTLCLWLISYCISLKCLDLKLIKMLIITFVGLQFIPSYYSGYFIAVIISFSLMCSRNKDEKKDIIA